MKKRFFASVMVLLLLGFCIVLIILRDRANTSFSTLTDSPCDPPCWYGITPGESTALDVMTALTKYDWINQNSVHNQKVGDKTIQIRWLFRKPVSDIAAYVYFDDEHVALINVMTFSSLNIKNAFVQFGQPEQVITYLYQGEVVVILIYPQNGVLLIMNVDSPGDPGQNFIKIQENTTISRVCYFDPAQPRELLSTSLYGSIPVKIGPDDVRPWQGIGQIKFR